MSKLFPPQRTQNHALSGKCDTSPRPNPSLLHICHLCLLSVDLTLLCALDRIFDDATVFNIKGESFRGKRLETVALQTSRVKAPDSSETPTP